MLSGLDPEFSRADEGRESLLIFVSVGVPIDTWLSCGCLSALGMILREYISLAPLHTNFLPRLDKSQKIYLTASQNG